MHCLLKYLQVICLEDAYIEVHGLPGGDLYEWATTSHMIRIVRWDEVCILGCKNENELLQWAQALEGAQISVLQVMSQ